jgi:hypothetical protein
MNQIFETIKPAGKAGRWAKPQATINVRGFIKLSRVAFEMLEAPERIHVLYDRANNKIALKASDRRDYNAHIPIAHGRDGEHGGRMIRVHGLVENLEGELYTCMRFHDIRLDKHDRLILDLVTATPAFHGKRVGVYEQWYVKNREKINAKAKENYKKRQAAKAAREDR